MRLMAFHARLAGGDNRPPSAGTQGRLGSRMARQTLRTARLAFFVTFISGALFPLQASADEAGKAEFDSRCASCHGQGGAGDGVVAPALRTKPSDLRRLTRNNGGVFPERVLVQVIDGRKSLRAHGNYEMPVWGNDLSNKKSTGSESINIKSIVDYIKAIQN